MRISNHCFLLLLYMRSVEICAASEDFESGCVSGDERDLWPS